MRWDLKAPPSSSVLQSPGGQQWSLRKAHLKDTSFFSLHKKKRITSISNSAPFYYQKSWLTLARAAWNTLPHTNKHWHTRTPLGFIFQSAKAFNQKVNGVIRKWFSSFFCIEFHIYCNIVLFLILLKKISLSCQIFSYIELSTTPQFIFKTIWGKIHLKM